MQLLFLRKEIENRIVRESNLFKDAVQVAVSNAFSKRQVRLWVKNSREYDDSTVSLSEIEEIQEIMDKKPPWTPWQGLGGGLDG